MKYKKRLSFLFLILVFFIVSASYYLLQDFGTYYEYSPEPAKMIKPAHLLDDYGYASYQPLALYPKQSAPGDFLIIETASPFTGDELTISFDFPGTVSSIYQPGNLLYAVVAISYEASPGRYEITISQQGDENIYINTEVDIIDKEFRLSRFSMPASRTEGWTAARLAEDREKVRAARSTTVPHPLWIQKFIHPLDVRVSSEYGAIRIINENPPRRHSGIDLAADEGTPIIAPNDGIVRLAEFLLSGGNTVIIDHGLNLSSTYMHLHEIYVEVGQKINRGDTLGTVGMTGYATGPHLHWEVNIGQVPVNPEQLLDNDLLWIPPAYINTLIDSNN